MNKILITYYSKTGNVKKMAEFIKETIKEEQIEVICESIENVDLDILLDVDGIIIGSPTYFGSMASPVKDFIDKSIKFYGKLNGKVGGCFTSCQRVGGGGETTLQSIINAFLIHGMIVQGFSKSSHYGPVAIASPDEVAQKDCKKLGQKIASLVKQLSK